MNKKSKIFLGVAIILIIGGIFTVKLWRGDVFYAVYLETGDLYFGRQVQFPVYGLKDVFVLQVNSSESEKPFSVQKFEDIFWGPNGILRLNREKVVWSVSIDSKSDLVNYFLSDKEESRALNTQVYDDKNEEAPLE